MSPTTTNCAKRLRQLFADGGSPNSNGGAYYHDPQLPLLNHNEGYAHMISPCDESSKRINVKAGSGSSHALRIISSENGIVDSFLDSKRVGKDRTSGFGCCCLVGSFAWLRQHLASLNTLHVKLIIMTFLLLLSAGAVIRLKVKGNLSHRSLARSSMFLSEADATMPVALLPSNNNNSDLRYQQSVIGEGKCTVHRYISTFKDGIVPEMLQLNLPLLPPTALWNVDSSHNLLMCSMSKVNTYMYRKLFRKLSGSTNYKSDDHRYLYSHLVMSGSIMPYFIPTACDLQHSFVEKYPYS